MAIQRRNPPKQLSDLKLLECENAKKNSRGIACGYCTQKVSKISPIIV